MLHPRLKWSFIYLEKIIDIKFLRAHDLERLSSSNSKRKSRSVKAFIFIIIDTLEYFIWRFRFDSHFKSLPDAFFYFCCTNRSISLLKKGSIFFPSGTLNGRNPARSEYWWELKWEFAIFCDQIKFRNVNKRHGWVNFTHSALGFISLSF